jgi:hypothetical protein
MRKKNLPKFRQLRSINEKIRHRVTKSVNQKSNLPKIVWRLRARIVGPK